MDRGLVHVGESLLRGAARPPRQPAFPAPGKDRGPLESRRPGTRAVPAPPLVVDLGYGAAATTTVELRRRLAVVRPDVEVVGVEIDPERVAAAQPYASPPELTFVRGGFDLTCVDRAPALVRAANVLRQYDEDEVAGAWRLLQDALAPGGLILEGTCDEIGRRSTWIVLDADGPRSLTISVAFGAIERPSDVAERLPKALIHRNVPGERVHTYLRALDAAWDRAAPLASYGRRQRFVAACADLRAQGWPVLDGPRRWRLGEIGVAWEAVRPTRTHPDSRPI